MSVGLLAVLAVLTYASRAAPLVLLPPPPPHAAAVLDRMPAPLFAGLAAAALIGDDGAAVALPTLAAVAGATIAAPTRSMPIILIAGMAAALAAAALG